MLLGRTLIRQLLTLTSIISILTGCLNGNVQWSRSSGSGNGSISRGSQGAASDSEGGSGGSSGGGGNQGGSGGSGGLVVKKITPSSGSWRGGYPVVVEGEQFKVGSQVSIGGQLCADVSGNPEGTRITCTLPRQSPDSLSDITVTNPLPTLETFTLPGAFNAKIVGYTSLPGERKVVSFGLENGTLKNFADAYIAETDASPNDLIVHPLLPVMYMTVNIGATNIKKDEIRPFSIDSAGALTPLPIQQVGKTTSGICLGPRHLYVIDQENPSTSTIYTFLLKADGSLGIFTTARADGGAISCVSAQGKFLYVLNAQSKSISYYKYENDIVQGSGTFNLGTTIQGPTMGLSPDGKFLILAGTDKVRTYTIDPETGALSFHMVLTLAETLVKTHLVAKPGTDRFYVSYSNFSPDRFGIASFSIDGSGVPNFLSNFDHNTEHPYRMFLSPKGDALMTLFGVGEALQVNGLNSENNVEVPIDSKAMNFPPMSLQLY